MAGSRTTRASCDFCYRRKLKCNRGTPQCSQCMTYATACTYGAPCRRSNVQKRGTVLLAGDDNQVTAERLEHLEAQVQHLTKRKGSHPERLELWPQYMTSTSPGNIFNGALGTKLTGVSPRLSDVPPLQRVLPLFQRFLEHFNGVLPLFHARSLLRLVHDFYRSTLQTRDPVAFAAIHTVLALTYRHVLVGRGNAEYSIVHLSKAQYVTSEVVLGPTKLLNIQVLVGMVMLLQGSYEHQPALVLIGTTVRLAHKLGLHNRAASAHLDTTEIKQRRNVFWLAYILDKDISMTYNQAAVQLDDDIDLDLPDAVEDDERFDETTNVDQPSTVATLNGLSEFDYFRARIQLAVIEGGVYDYLYSTRAQKRSPEERAVALESVYRALDQWKTSIPPSFAAEAAIGYVASSSHRFLAVLHSTSLLCTTLVNKAHAWDQKWISSLKANAATGTAFWVPTSWNQMVTESRGLIKLVESLPEMDPANFW